MQSVSICFCRFFTESLIKFIRVLPFYVSFRIILKYLRGWNRLQFIFSKIFAVMYTVIFSKKVVLAEMYVYLYYISILRSSIYSISYTHAMPLGKFRSCLAHETTIFHRSFVTPSARVLIPRRGAKSREFFSIFLEFEIR